MGVGVSENSSTDIFRAESDVYQKYKGTCEAKCDNIISNVTIVLQNSQLEGGINFDQTCSANASCTFNTTMTDLQKATQTALKTQIAKNASGPVKAGSAGFGWLIGVAGLGVGIDSNEEYTDQEVYQSLTQVIDQTCAADSNDLTENVTIMASGSNLQGGINFTQSNDAQAACIMDTTMQAQLLSDQKLDLKQTSGGSDWMTYLMIFLFVILAVGILRMMWKTKKSGPGQGACPTNKPISFQNQCYPKCTPGYGYKVVTQQDITDGNTSAKVGNVACVKGAMGGVDTSLGVNPSAIPSQTNTRGSAMNTLMSSWGGTGSETPSKTGTVARLESEVATHPQLTETAEEAAVL